MAGKNSRERNNRGRWTRQEHEQFLGGLEAVGEIWCLVATYVPTRTELQTRTHAQKYLRKIRQGLPFPEEVRSFPSPSLPLSLSLSFFPWLWVYIFTTYYAPYT